jgi:hypothetical protein
VTAAHNTSSTSLYLSWQPPEPNSIHGEFLGYRISYRPRDVGAAKAVEVPIENPKATVSQPFFAVQKQRLVRLDFQGLGSGFILWAWAFWASRIYNTGRAKVGLRFGLRVWVFFY